MRTYTIVVEPEESGSFFVTVPALPGCFTRAATVEQCQERAIEAIEVHIAGLRADDVPVPQEIGRPQLLAVRGCPMQPYRSAVLRRAADESLLDRY